MIGYDRVPSRGDSLSRRASACGAQIGLASAAAGVLGPTFAPLLVAHMAWRFVRACICVTAHILVHLLAACCSMASADGAIMKSNMPCVWWL